MTRVRVIPVLLLAQHGMVKTVRFTRRRYLGDPINAVRIFNEKMADELILLDIEATAKGRIEFDWVEDIVSEAFMPIAYGGGITTITQCSELFRRGVEKVILNTAAYTQPELIQAASSMFGSQSILVSIDCKRTLWGKQNVFVRAGRTNTGLSPLEHAVNCGHLGAGELIVTSIDREGTYRGYDCELYSSITSNVGMPVIANGGAAGVHDFHSAVLHGGCSAVAAGSMFVYAAQNQGVLINYPPQDELHKELRGLLGDNGDHQFQYV